MCETKIIVEGNNKAIQRTNKNAEKITESYYNYKIINLDGNQYPAPMGVRDSMMIGFSGLFQRTHNKYLYEWFYVDENGEKIIERPLSTNAHLFITGSHGIFNFKEVRYHDGSNNAIDTIFRFNDGWKHFYLRMYNNGDRSLVEHHFKVLILDSSRSGVNASCS